MKRASPEEDESSCALMRMDNKDDGDDADFSMNYCWQTVTAPDAECTMVDDFPLRRHACGFFPVGYDHSGHEADRVKVLVSLACRLSVTTWGMREVSDQDCDYTPFTQLVSPALPDRELETIRAFLNAQLRCDPVHSTICRIPIDDEHQDKIMVIHPTILSDHEADSHRNFSQVFRDIGLTV